VEKRGMNMLPFGKSIIQLLSCSQLKLRNSGIIFFYLNS
jgi:hypothetical protein